MAAPSTRDFASPAVVDATGPIFVANIENSFLMGALVLQAYYYWTRFQNKDRWPLKVVAIVPVFIEVAQTILVIHDGFAMFCRNWGGTDILSALGLLWLYLPILGVFTSVWTKLFYTWRLYSLTRLKWVACLIMFLAFATFVSGVATGIGIIPLKTVQELAKIDIQATTWLAATMACDLSIMCLMTFFLRRSRTGFKRTDALLWRLISLSLETGGVCCLMTTLHLILYLGWPSHAWHLAISIPEGKLYANSLLVILNQRADLADSESGGGTSHDWKSFPTSTHTSGLSPAMPRSFINVEVTKDVDIVSDLELRTRQTYPNVQSPGFDKLKQRELE